MRASRAGALAGLAAAAVAIGAGELVASVVAPRAAPLVAVGGAVIDAAPEWAKDLAIRLFGTNDKLALQIGTVLLLAAAAAGLGTAAVRRRWIGLAGIGAFGLIGVTTALTRAGAGPAWAVPSLLGALAAAATLLVLLSWVGLPEAGLPVSGDRRGALATAWLLVVGGFAVTLVGRSIGQRRGVNQLRNSLPLPTPSGRPALAPSGADVVDLPYTTSNSDFYRIDTAITVPVIDPAHWRLRIHGRVRRPLTLTFDELLARPMIERFVTLACVSNPVGGDLIGNARWLGVPLAELLDEVEPEEGADQVVGRSVDGFTAGMPTAVVRDGRDAMIAVAMNGEALPIDHGFPARLVVPGLYGYVSATKWLVELELTSFEDFEGYWIPRGWSRFGPIKTQSRIDRPRAGSTVVAGPTVVAGVAWAQHRGISAVQVRLDDGAWLDATLAATASIDTWRLWSLTVDVPAGRHELTVRAADNAGAVQTQQRTPSAPDGATGWHAVTITAG